MFNDSLQTNLLTIIIQLYNGCVLQHGNVRNVRAFESTECQNGQTKLIVFDTFLQSKESFKREFSVVTILGEDKQYFLGILYGFARGWHHISPLGTQSAVRRTSDHGNQSTEAPFWKPRTHRPVRTLPGRHIPWSSPATSPTRLRHLNLESVRRPFNVIDCLKWKPGYRTLKWYSPFVKPLTRV